MNSHIYISGVTDPEVNTWKSLSEATCNLLPRLVHVQLSLPAFKVFVKC